MTVIVAAPGSPQIFDAAQARADTVNLLIALARNFQNAIAYRAAIAGDLNSTVLVPGTSRRIYAQLDAVGGDVAEAKIDSFTPQAGNGVLLMRSRTEKISEWLVLGHLTGDAPCIDPTP